MAKRRRIAEVPEVSAQVTLKGRICRVRERGRGASARVRPHVTGQGRVPKEAERNT